MLILKAESARASRLGLLGRCASFPNHVYNLDKVGKEIESIRRRLQDIESSRVRYGIKEEAEPGRRFEENVEQWRRLAPWQKDKHLVGLDEDVAVLLQESILDEKKKGLSLAAVVGMGGIGKSTFAKKIYNHAVVANRFQYRAWVVVSSEFTPEDIIKQIMLQMHISLSDDTIKVLESMKDKLSRQAILQEMLHKQLVSKRYFIVLDDVWEPTHWESLKSAFPDEQGETSRLLITSRNRIITERCGYVHKMRLLNQDESWELLLETAFLGKTDGKYPQELESIGREILRKCGGLPLAIMVAGGLLVNQQVWRSGWEKVLKQIPETSQNCPNVSAILELSYRNLPPRLKPCFLCLSFFQEDAIIRAKRLVYIWITQGFISSEEDGGGVLAREEIAMSYLNELINRNLVQVEEMGGTYGVVKTCRIHDLLHELAIKKAKEEIGFEILREEGSSSSKPLNKPRHAVYYSGEGLLSSNQNKHLRSLFLISGPSLPCSKYFELLRILDVEAIVHDKLPNTYRALVGLKYLRIRDVIQLKLPTWFNCLKNLEILETGKGFGVLPNATLKMDSLRHVYAGGISGPLKKGTCKNLQTLKYIRTGRPKAIHIPSRVRKLGLLMEGSEMERRVAAKLLEKLENLAHLHVRGNPLDCHYIFRAVSRLDHLTKLKVRGHLVINGLPDASVFPQNISRLTLTVTGLTSDPMTTLGKLPKLSHLKLSSAYLGKDMRVLREGFPMLQALSLHKMHNLSCVYIEEGGMPELRRVDINDCPNLETLNLQQYRAPISNIN